MYRLILSSLFVMFFCVDANASDANFAFLVLKASAIDQVDQPTYICLSRKNRCNHIPPNEPYVKIKPGHYRMTHIDFSEHEASGRGSDVFDKIELLKLKKGRVYFIGNLKLSNRSGGRFKMSLEQEMSDLREACKAFPKHVKLFPFANPKNGNATNLSCINVH